jgi:hypothetical protein
MIQRTGSRTSNGTRCSAISDIVDGDGLLLDTERDVGLV